MSAAGGRACMGGEVATEASEAQSLLLKLAEHLTVVTACARAYGAGTQQDDIVAKQLEELFAVVRLIERWVSETDAFRTKLAARLRQLNADLADSARRYGAGAPPDDIVAEQLVVVLTLINRWVEPHASLRPLWEHWRLLVDGQSSRHGCGNNPPGVVEASLRTTALTFMQLALDARGGKDLDGAAAAAAAVYPCFTAGQLKSLRKHLDGRRGDRRLREARDWFLAFWRGKYPGRLQEAIEEMKKIARGGEESSLGWVT